MKPKLLYILPEYNARTDSHLFHLFELLEELGKSMDIFLLVEKGNTNPPIKNIKTIYVQKHTAFPANIIERAFIIAKARISGYKKAYIHYSYWGAILSSLIFRPSRGSVYYWHCEVYDAFHSGRLLKKALDEWPMMLALKIVNYLITGTPRVARFYQQQFALPRSKIKILPNWVNLKRFRHTPKKNSKAVLFLHRLAPRKGADLLPKIIMETLALDSKINFSIVGGGPLLNNLKSLKEAKVVGPVPNSEVKGYLERANLFIMPSRQEGFPRVLLEAMATGTPFVATNVGGTSDILTSFQIQNSLASLEDFPTKIVRLVNDKQLSKKLIQDGLKHVQKYDLSKVSKQFINLLS